MKQFIVLSCLILSATVQVLAAGTDTQKNCQQEAQVIGKVKSYEKSLYGCQVILDGASIQFYKASQVCPLELDEVVLSPIQVGLSGGHDCRLDVGDTLSGVLIKNSAGQIILD